MKKAKKNCLRITDLDPQTLFLTKVNRRWLRKQSADYDMHLYQYIHHLFNGLRKNKLKLEDLK